MSKIKQLEKRLKELELELEIQAIEQILRPAKMFWPIGEPTPRFIDTSKTTEYKPEPGMPGLFRVWS